MFIISLNLLKSSYVLTPNIGVIGYLGMSLDVRAGPGMSKNDLGWNWDVLGRFCDEM